MSIETATIATDSAATRRVLRKLFMTLFLRGRSARGLRKETAPKSVGSKLAVSLLTYAAIGLMALVFARQSVFAMSVYLHAMTFAFVGMFVAGSAGEILFNKDESEILLHRPVSARELLWTKVRVLVEVSLWMAGAFNLAGFAIGVVMKDGGWMYPVAHAVSTALEALFCTGCVVLAYQLCLRWFGRERLEGLMTTTQVLVSLAVVIGGQVVPRLMLQVDRVVVLRAETWWVALLPPAWFAGLDDAIAGSGAMASWLLGAIGVVSAGAVMWMAIGKLAGDYGAGLQMINETAARRPRGGKRRWVDVVANVGPMRWLLREPVARASFLLTAAYLVRDRDLKLRMYPGIAPLLVVPVIFLVQGRDNVMGGFSTAFVGCYAGLIPMVALTTLQFSQQWQASDLFRVAPMRARPIYRGARVAVMLFLGVPLVLLMAGAVMVMHRQIGQLVMMLPGVMMLPVYMLLPHMGGRAVPLSLPTEEAKGAGRGMVMILAMVVSMGLAALAIAARMLGVFWWFVALEGVVVAAVYTGMRAVLERTGWRSAE